MRRGAALLLALAALVATGCGGDDETAETVPPAPELSLPGDEEAPTLDDLSGSTTGTSTDGSDAAPAPGGQAPNEASPPADGGGDQGGQQQPPSGGQPAPDDTPDNDQPPPPGSPAERFEQFCEENPGAC